MNASTGLVLTGVFAILCDSTEAQRQRRDAHAGLIANALTSRGLARADCDGMCPDPVRRSECPRRAENPEPRAPSWPVLDQGSLRQRPPPLRREARLVRCQAPLKLVCLA